MLLVSLLLLTLWLGGLVADVTLGGFVHLLAVSAVAIVFARADHHRATYRPRRSRVPSGIPARPVA